MGGAFLVGNEKLAMEQTHKTAHRIPKWARTCVGWAALGYAAWRAVGCIALLSSYVMYAHRTVLVVSAVAFPVTFFVFASPALVAWGFGNEGISAEHAPKSVPRAWFRALAYLVGGMVLSDALAALLKLLVILASK